MQSQFKMSDFIDPKVLEMALGATQSSFAIGTDPKQKALEAIGPRPLTAADINPIVLERVALGVRQPRMTMEDRWYPLRFVKNGPIVGYVSPTHIMSAYQYARKIQGKRSFYLGESSDSIGYLKVSLDSHACKVSRCRVAAVLNVAYTELMPGIYDVDHIDNCITNNDISNLQLLTRPDHAKKTALNNPGNGKRIGLLLGKQVVQLDINGVPMRDYNNEIITFRSCTAAAEEFGVSISSMSVYILEDWVLTVHYPTWNDTYKYRFAYSKAIPEKLRILKETAEAKYALYNPDTGLEIPGYVIYDNLLIENLKTGRPTLGYKLGNYYRFQIQGKHFGTHRLLVASREKRIVLLDVLHKDDRYENVVSADLTEGTNKQNRIEAGGIKIKVDHILIHHPFDKTYTTLGEVAELFDIPYSTFTDSIYRGYFSELHIHKVKEFTFELVD